MKKLFLSLSLVAFALGAQAQYQIPNSDFENWGSDENEPGNGWYSFSSATGSMANTGRRYVLTSTTQVEGHESESAVQLESRRAVIYNANGNLTTGMINMGNMQPTNENNYNYTKRKSANCCPFSGHPDAFEYWAKFSRGNSSGTYNAQCKVIIHGDTDYRDPKETSTNEATYKIATVTVSADPCTNWTKFSGNLAYANPTNPGENTYVLATFTTHPDPGGSSGDTFVIDDIKFVYWHALSALSYEGVTLGFNEATTSYSLPSVEYDETKLSYTVKGRAATASKSYDAATGILTIRVEGEDFGTNAEMFQDPTSYTEYTIQFKHKVAEKTYTEDLYVTLDGYTFDKEETAVLVETYSDNTIDFSLNNFMLAGGPVGNIAVKNIAVASDNTFAFEGGIQITPGNVSGIDEEEWGGPEITEMCGGSVPLDLRGKFVGEDHVVVTIAIDLTETLLEQMIDVHLGYARATMAVDAEAQYGTFCAPYAVAIPDGVEAYTVPSVFGGLLTLSDVSETIPANTPVILFAANGFEEVESFGVAESGTPTEGLLIGVYEPTLAPVGSYVLQNNGKVGFYQVAAGQQPTVGANRCYLTVPAGVKAAAFFFDEDDATAIKAIDNAQQTTEGAAIYNLAGQRMSKMQKGINIINGKKILK